MKRIRKLTEVCDSCAVILYMFAGFVYNQSCDFEVDTCKWTQSKKGDKLDWTRSRGSASVARHTGPTTDHTSIIYKKLKGYYLSIGSSTLEAGDNAILLSPTINNNEICFSFWYHISGANTGSLKVYSISNGTIEETWKVSWINGSGWRNSQVTIYKQSEFQIALEGIANKPDDYISIDDLNISIGKCMDGNSRGECNFEKGFCGWKQSESHLNEFGWILSDGESYVGTGAPSTDHTTQQKTGKYALLESSPNKDVSAWLIYEESRHNSSEDQCINFWVYMNSKDVGQLNVYVYDQIIGNYIVWGLSGSQEYTGWFNGQARMTTTGNYQVAIAALLNSGNGGAIAIDDISITNDTDCPNKPSASAPSAATYIISLKDAPLPSGNEAFDSTQYSCNFTFGKCSWTDANVDLNWTRHQGRTSDQRGIGISGDHLTGSSGWYVFINSTGYKPGDQARLMSDIVPPIIPARSSLCLQFWYHMYGDHIGTLRVYLKVTRGDMAGPIWTKKGTVGPRWRHGLVDIKSQLEFQLYFEGTVGDGEFGDIGLDDLSLSEGKCPPSDECTFEEDVCGWHNMTGAEASWLRHKGSDPAIDHTYGTDKGYYAQAQNAGFRTKAIMESAAYGPTNGSCFTFWYYKHSSFGSLTVKFSQGGKTIGHPFRVKEHASKWKPQRINVKSAKEFTIIFEAETHGHPISVDDIEVLHHPCEPPGNCDFARDKCGYENAENDGFDWLLGSGKTTSKEGPSVDHSTGNDNGQYIFILPESREIHETAILTSEEIPDNGVGKCVEFWYYLNGPNVGGIELQMAVLLRSSHRATATWKLSGDQPKKWLRGQAPFISHKKDILLNVVGIRGKDDQGKSAIDDIKVTDYTDSCKIYPTNAVPWGCNFELGLCGWKQEKNDDAEWSLVTGEGTATAEKPTTDHTTVTGKGKFIFLDASNGKYQNGTAAVISPPIYTNGGRSPYCVVFAYYATNPDDGNSIRLYKVKEGEKKPVMWKVVEYQNRWLDQSVQLSVENGTQIVIEGVRGISYKGSIAIDDIDLSYGDCASLTGRCTFESPRICGMANKGGNKVNWQRKSASTLLGSRPEPKEDHTLRTPHGHFMFLNSTLMKADTTSTLIVARVLSKQGPSCMQFFYYMGKDADDKDRLTLVVSNLYSETAKRLTVTGANKGAWYMAQLSFKDLRGSKVEFIASSTHSNPSIMAIDDFRVVVGECPSMGSCDFEQEDFCSWSEDEKADGFHWKVDSGHSTGFGTAPKVDHTTLTNGGTYATFISKPGSSYKGQLVSPTFNATNGHCMLFWYYMNGTGTGDLNIYMKGKDKTNKLATISGNQGPVWNEKEIGLYSQTDFKVILEGVSSGKNGEVAIDDVTIKEGNCVGRCSLLPATARIPCGPSNVTPTSCVRELGCCYEKPSCFFHPAQCGSIATHLRVECGNTGISKAECKQKGCCYDDEAGSSGHPRCYNSPATPTPFPTTPTPRTTPAPSVYDCTFEHGQCNYTNLNKFHWKRNQGATISRGATTSRGTGPKTDHTLQNNKGWYMYFEADNYPAKAIANLQTPEINFPHGGSDVCVRFWFHMYGQHVNKLNVFVTIGDGKLVSPLWYRKGQIADKWHFAHLRVRRQPAFKVTFQGVRGNGVLGDIAIDDVSFINGKCPPTLLCDFENDDLCGWSQDTHADFDWIRGSGNTTAGKVMAPDADHSYQTRFGRYMYIGGKKHKPGDYARMESFENNPTKSESACVEFYYYMKGEDVGTLNLFVRRGKVVDKKAAWALSGNQGGTWNRALVTIVKATLKWRVILEGITGGDVNSVIAVDDVHLLSVACVPRGDCDFEDNNLCGYENNPNNKINWNIKTGLASTYNTGPTTDHTTGLVTGHYIYIVGSIGVQWRGQVISEILKVPSYKWCLTFWFHMYGDGVEALRVYKRSITRGPGDKFNYTKIFQENDNHDDRWYEAQVNFTVSRNFQIVFEGEPSNGVGHQSIIAIDDIKLLEGFCAAKNRTTPEKCAVRCKDQRCISSDKVCDFFPDCAQGKFKDDDTDERGCNQCDFENGFCKWKDISKGTFQWNRTQAAQAKKTKRFTGPSKDHTKGTALGYYVYTNATVGSMHNRAILEGPVNKQASSTCTLTFWYHMFGEDVGHLLVYVLYGDRLTLLWKMTGNKGDQWNQGVAYISRRVQPFIIKFEVERYTGTKGDIALDDIKFVNCSLPKPSTTCSGNHFQCTKTRACIPRDRVCDFTDDCGDGSDESKCPEEEFPYRCNFENSLCSWENIHDRKVAHHSFIRRKALLPLLAFTNSEGPYFDHTTHTVSGYYIYAGGRYFAPPIRFGSSLLKGTATSSPCQIRFYYRFLTSKALASFSVKTRDCKGCNKDTTVWTTSTSEMDKWIRQAVALKSAAPFQVMFELDVKTKGVVFIDDVSFYGCSMHKGTLPTQPPPTTTAAPTTSIAPTTRGVVPTTHQVCHENEFYCKKDNKCIDGRYKCDYQEDCSDGEDEVSCGSCDFEASLCGYAPEGGSSVSFVQAQPGHDSEPATDHTLKSKTGHFVVTRAGSHSEKKHVAIVKSPELSNTSSTCTLEFYCYYNGNGDVALSTQSSHEGYNSVLLRETLTSSKDWQRVLIAVGSRPSDWTIHMDAYDNGIAVDDIKFHNCSFPRPAKTCNKQQARCDDGGCIDVDKVCDLSADCFDGSDERADKCKTVKEQCTFEDNLCHWRQDKDDGYDWSRETGKTTSRENAPSFDHTSGNDNGYFIFVKTRTGVTNQAARLTSVVFKVSQDVCRMTFFYRMSGKHAETLSIKKRTIKKSKVHMEVVSDKISNDGTMWKHASVLLKSEADFEVVIEAEIGSHLEGGIAIDDITFSPGCQPDVNATLSSKVHTCKDGFSCGDGQCIESWKVCNFVADCKNKADEEECPSSCDYEGGDTCHWYNDKTDIMDWRLIHGLTPSEGKGPSRDHTKNNKNGHFIYMETDQPEQENLYPFATFMSPTFNQASYVCTFTFWYMYHANVDDKNDAHLHLLYRRNDRDTILFANTDTTGNKWKQKVVELPRCPDHFKIVFVGKHYWKTTTRISIDDWKFDCAEKAPTPCDSTTEFQCHYTKQCIPKSTVCDMDRNCCDGSDESASTCKGYTKVDFESGLEGWVQLKNDDFDFEIQSGDTTSLDTGPSYDHTLQEAHGKYIFAEASQHVNQKAMIGSPAIIATSSSHAPSCSISFWYNMYGKDMGSLTLFTATHYGAPENMFWNKSSDQGKGWKNASVVLSCMKDFQIIFVATIGRNYLSDVALDDISLSPGCKLKKKHLPGDPTVTLVNPCSPRFKCQSSGICIPRNQVCDFEADCPDGSDENKVTCGYPLDFQNGVGPWRKSLSKDFMFNLHRGGPGEEFATREGHTGKGTYLYLKVANRPMGGKAVLSSPPYENAYSNCILKFSYYLYGKDVGTLQIRLNINHTKPTYIFDVRGDQGDKWIETYVSIGRRRRPFNLDVIATTGGGDDGEIAIDDINFFNCSTPPVGATCGRNSDEKFQCSNNLCIDKSKICNFVDDCGDLSDEGADACTNYTGINFEHIAARAFNITQDGSDDFDWALHSGPTPSRNTGPTHDHTLRSSGGHYMYVEASGRKKGEKTRLSTSPMYASTRSKCLLTFYYHMYGKDIGGLNIYTLKNGSKGQQLERKLSGNHGFQWKQAVVDLSSHREPFSIIFEGVIGNSFEGDIAIDDVIISPGCVTNTPRVFPSTQMCKSDEFVCKRRGNCVLRTTLCDGYMDCKDGSDEDQCQHGKRFLPSGMSSCYVGSIVGTILFLLLVTAMTIILLRRRRDKALHLFSVFYNSTKPEVEQNGKVVYDTHVSITEGVSNPVYYEQPNGDVSTDNIDVELYNDCFQDDEYAHCDTPNMGNPLYQDPYMEEDDSPLSKY